jgi:hypothetical protein
MTDPNPWAAPEVKQVLGCPGGFGEAKANVMMSRPMLSPRSRPFLPCCERLAESMLATIPIAAGAGAHSDSLMLTFHGLRRKAQTDSNLPRSVHAGYAPLQVAYVQIAKNCPLKSPAAHNR